MKILIKIVVSFIPIVYFVFFVFPTQLFFNLADFSILIVLVFFLILYMVAYFSISSLLNKKYLVFSIVCTVLIAGIFFGSVVFGCNGYVGGSCKTVMNSFKQSQELLPDRSYLDSTENWKTTTFSTLTIKYPPTWQAYNGQSSQSGKLTLVSDIPLGYVDGGGNSHASMTVGGNINAEDCVNGFVTSKNTGNPSGNYVFKDSKCVVVKGIPIWTPFESTKISEAFDLIIKNIK